MKGIKLINGINTLINSYHGALEEINNGINVEANEEALKKFPGTFYYLYLIQDEVYPQKYVIRLSFEEHLEEMKDDDIIIIDFFIKENDELDEGRTVSYIKKVDNGNISKVYYNNFVNNIPKRYNCFVLDFLSEIFGMEFKFSNEDIQMLKNAI